MKEVLTIIEETKEKVNEYRQSYISNEQAVRTQLIEPVLNILGWKTYDPRYVRPNAPDEDGKIPDYTLLKEGKTTLIVEAKNLSIDLQDKKIIDQLANYCFSRGIDFGILTNGIKWLLFKTFERNPKDRIIWQVDLENDRSDYVANNIASFSYHNIDELDSLLKKSKTLDEAWKTLIVTSDNIVTIISQKILENIKSQDKSFRIDTDDLNSFVKGKMEDLFVLEDIQNDYDDTQNGNDKESKISNEFDEVEKSIFKKQSKTKKREKISITFPDKTIFNDSKVVNTFLQTIAKIGPERIINLGISRADVPIVSNTKHAFYHQKQLGRYWIMVHTSTKEKVKIINEINDTLGLNLVIESFVNEMYN